MPKRISNTFIDSRKKKKGGKTFSELLSLRKELNNESYITRAVDSLAGIITAELLKKGTRMRKRYGK